MAQDAPGQIRSAVIDGVRAPSAAADGSDASAAAGGSDASSAKRSATSAYWRKRESAARALADAAADPHIARLHVQMAERYAELSRDEAAAERMR